MHAQSLAEVSPQINLSTIELDDPLLSPKIWFYTTNKCNINCQYCFNYINKDHEDLPADVAVDILKACLNHHHINSMQYKFIHMMFLGGEPTINHETIFALVDYADNNGIKILPHILTNGIMKESVLQRLIDRKVYFQVSFDGYQNNVRWGHNQGKDLNLIVMRTLEKIAAKLPFTIRATIHGDNVDHMVEIVKLVAPFQPQQLLFMPTYLDGNAITYKVKQPPARRFFNYFLQARAIGQELGVPVGCSLDTRKLELNSGKHHFPLVWLPDGKLSLSITYASSKSLGAERGIIGQFNHENKTIWIDQAKMAEIKAEFFVARDKACSPCKIYHACQGRSNFNQFLLRRPVGIPEFVFCEVSRMLHADNELKNLA